MLPMAALKVLLVLPILLVAAAFLGTSALALIRKRPVLVRGSHCLWFIGASMVPTILALILLAGSVAKSATSCYVLLQIVLLLAVVLVVRRSLRGYLVLAVTHESFRAALRGALQDLGIPFQETLVGFSLSEPRDTLRTWIPPRSGMAQFQMQSSDRSELLTRVADRLRDHLRTDRGSMALGSALIFGAAGLVALALAIYQAQRL